MHFSVQPTITNNTCFRAIPKNMDYAKLNESFSGKFINDLQRNIDVLKESKIVDLGFVEGNDGLYKRAYLKLNENFNHIKKGDEIYFDKEKTGAVVDSNKLFLPILRNFGGSDVSETIPLYFCYSDILKRVLSFVKHEIIEENGHDRIVIPELPTLGTLIHYAGELYNPLELVKKILKQA